MAQRFWPVNFKGSDLSFSRIDSVADEKNVAFFIFAASLHLPSVGCDVLKHAFSVEASLSRGQNVLSLAKYMLI